MEIPVKGPKQVNYLMNRLAQTNRKENPVTKLSSLSITLAATGLLLISAGCQSLSTGTNLVSVVKNGTIEAYPSVPIGKAFEATFDNPQWRSAESEKGVKFVEGGYLLDSGSPYILW
jgi:hypothetical protein